jgi:hypothetical protein
MTGLVASVVYVGSIVNAVDISSRRNDAAADAARDPLERHLVPDRFQPAAP